MNSSRVQFYDRYHKKNNNTFKIIDRNNITYWFIIRLIEQSVPNLNQKLILDIGCGVGTIGFFLVKQGAVVLGLDVSKRAIELAKHTQIANQFESIKFAQIDISDADDSNASFKRLSSKFDLIICTEVLEHVTEDKRLLIECRKLLKSSGVIVITTQSSEGLLAKSGFFKKHDDAVGHLRRYKPDALIKLIESSGLMVIKIQNADGLLRSVLYTTKLGFLLKFIRGPLIPIFQWLDLQTIKIFGAADIQIVAKRS